MMRDQILKLIDQPGTPIQLECLCVGYVFDFSCSPLKVGDRLLFELGWNDAGIPIVVDPSNAHIYLYAEHRLFFINSSFAQMLRAFATVSGCEVSNSLPDVERASIFQTRMLEIDPECFHDPEAHWSILKEEMQRGLI